MITYGTNPGQGVGVTQPVPDPAALNDANQSAGRCVRRSTTCNLSRTSRCSAIPSTSSSSAAAPTRAFPTCAKPPTSLKGRKVSPKVAHYGRARLGKDSSKQAEAEGLHEIFRAAGAEWRQAGCSMCIAMNGDQLSPGQYSVSTSNRNFEGRQGKGGRTFLASPADRRGLGHRRRGCRRPPST